MTSSIMIMTILLLLPRHRAFVPLAPQSVISTTHERLFHRQEARRRRRHPPISTIPNNDDQQQQQHHHSSSLSMTIKRSSVTTATHRQKTHLSFSKRYGPPPSSSFENDDDDDDDELELDDATIEKNERDRLARRENQILSLLTQIKNATSPESLPGIMSRNTDAILSVSSIDGTQILERIITRAREDDDGDTVAAAEYMVSFLEEFVDQAKSIEGAYASLVGKIIRAMMDGGGGGGDGDGGKEEKEGGGSEAEAAARRVSREEVLDGVLEEEKDNFNPGFLRYLEGECRRIQGAKKMTPESSKLLQTIKMIQIRVVEELGKDLGEAALVLGQVLGYETRDERLAVLRAGMTVRGVEFARELADLAEEALEGFKSMPPGVADPELVVMVEEVYETIKEFVESQSVLE